MIPDPVRATGIALLIATTGLGGCASYTATTVKKLDPQHPRYQTEECNSLIAGNVERQEEIKVGRLVGTPIALLLSGGLALPVIAANTALDVNDQRVAAKISEHCSDKRVGDADIVMEVGKNAAFSAVTQGLGILPSGAVKVQSSGR